MTKNRHHQVFTGNENTSEKIIFYLYEIIFYLTQTVNLYNLEPL